jgi:hypothetical protein
MAEDTFEQRLQAFYDEGTDEDRELIRFMCTATLAMAQRRDAPEVEGFQFSAAPGGSVPGIEVPSFGVVQFTAPPTDHQNAVLGNMLKKMSDTQQGITQNLK